MESAALVEMYLAAVAAVDPADLVEGALRRRGIDGAQRPVVVLALGKAAAGMALGAARVFGDTMTGIAAMAQDSPLPAGIEAVIGGHPIPDASSVIAGERLLAAAHGAPPDALVVCLISGGGSAIAELPVAGLTIDDLGRLNERLLASGATIAEINSVRRALSRLKGGRLAAAVAPRRLITLAISDVGSAPPETIASGPTLPPRPGAGSPIAVLRKYGILADFGGFLAAAESIPAPVPQDFEVVADGATAAAAALASAVATGVTARVAERELVGEARHEARRVVAEAELMGTDVVVHHGETTVTIVGSGRGGRSHEAGLAAAIAIEGSDKQFLAAGTDGVDGSSGGAGVVVDGNTARLGREAGYDPERLLAENDSGRFFDGVPGRIVTGPTGTNVADIWLVARRT